MSTLYCTGTIHPKPFSKGGNNQLTLCWQTRTFSYLLGTSWLVPPLLSLRDWPMEVSWMVSDVIPLVEGSSARPLGSLKRWSPGTLTKGTSRSASPSRRPSISQRGAPCPLFLCRREGPTGGVTWYPGFHNTDIVHFLMLVTYNSPESRSHSGAKESSGKHGLYGGPGGCDHIIL
jgi:hypothetical protein